MGFYPVEVLINDAKRHGVCILPVDVNRSRYRTTSEWAGMPDEPLPDGAGITERPEVVQSSGCVVPDRDARDHWAAPTSIGYGIRLGLHLVKGIGDAEGEALDAEISARGPFTSLADLVSRTELSEEVVERLIRAGALDSLGEPRRLLLWQLQEVATVTRSNKTLDLRLPPTQAPDLPPPTELERLGDSYAILSLDARRQVIELFRPALDALGVVRAGELADAKPGRVRIGGLVVTRQHPMTARGTVFLALEDETGMVNVTLWPDTWARFRRTVRRHALLYIEGRLERESNVVNVIADRVESLSEMARPAGGPVQPEGVRHMGHAGMRRQN
jgi:error-prone DNA polymerase